MSDDAATQYVICTLDDLPNKRGKGFQLLRRNTDGGESVWSVFIVRWGSQVFGYLNVCPHQGTHLDWERNQFLDPNGLRLMCGKHGATFEIGTGRCIDGPCQGQALTSIDVALIDGDVCVSGVDLVDDDADSLVAV